MSQPPDQRKPQRDASLSKLSIQNFKAFGEMVDVPIRPITLIFGENSSGKSSILHSLLFLNQMQYQPQEQLADITYTKIGGNSVDLGGIPQLIFKQTSTEKLQFRMDIPVDLSNWGADKSLLTRYWSPTLQDNFNKSKSLRYQLQLVSWKSELKFAFTLTMTVTLSKEQALERIDYFIDNTPLCSFTKFRTESTVFNPSVYLTFAIEGMSKSTFEFIDKYVYFYFAMRQFDLVDIKPDISGNKKTPDYYNIDILKNMNLSEITYQLKLDHYTIKNSSVILLEKDLLEIMHKNSFDKNSMLSPQKYPVFDRILTRFLHTVVDLNINSAINNIAYLGPIRTIPTRNFDTLDSINRDPSTGSTAWDKLANDEQLRTHVNFWLDKFGTNKQITTEQLVDTAQLRKIVSESVSTTQIEDIIKQLATRNLLRFYDPQKDIHLSHRDLGVGISQVLPVLVNSIANSDTTVLIEQPELHLHPRLQGDLADLFIDTAIKGEQQNTYIIETHSEHIIRRIMRRIREDQHKSANELRITKEDVAILYVASGPNGSTVTHLRLDDEGDLIDEWPNGFFEESFRDDIAGR